MYFYTYMYTQLSWLMRYLNHFRTVLFHFSANFDKLSKMWREQLLGSFKFLKNLAELRWGGWWGGDQIFFTFQDPLITNPRCNIYVCMRFSFVHAAGRSFCSIFTKLGIIRCIGMDEQRTLLRFWSWSTSRGSFGEGSENIEIPNFVIFIRAGLKKLEKVRFRGYHFWKRFIR